MAEARSTGGDIGTAADEAAQDAGEAGDGPVMVQDDALIAVADSKVPKLEAGTYLLDVTTSLTAGAGESYGAALHTRIIEVAGPRFVIGPDQIEGRFPPQGGQGWFGDSLPHVTLKRPTLPWERHAHGAGDGLSNLPWLALVAVPRNVPSQTYTAPVTRELANALGLSDASAFPAKSAEGDAPGAALARILTFNTDANGAPVEADKAQENADAILPDRQSLALGAHVRWIGNGDGDAPARAVVVGARPLRPGAHVFHLVSLENRTVSKRVEGGCSFVSLLSWEAEIIEPDDAGQGHAIEAFLHKIVPGRFGEAAKAEAEGALAVATGGREVLRHRLRSGEQTVSLYRGPFCGDISDRPGIDLAATTASADHLLIVDAALGLIDASYAAAFELGRLLTLSRPSVGRALGAWKRDHARHHACCTVCDAHQDLTHDIEPGAPPEFGDALAQYFTRDIGLLAAVPFAYLVPDPDLLPPERLRFFDIDPDWIACLTHGAAAVGQMPGMAARCEEACCEKAAACAEAAASGILLRSALLSDWPDVILDGLDSAGARIAPLRDDMLGPQTRLVLFPERIASLKIHLHPQGLHFARPTREDAPDLSDWKDLTLGEIADRLLGTNEAMAAQRHSPSAIARDLMAGTPHRTFHATPSPEGSDDK